MSTVPRIPAASLREAFALQPEVFDAFWDLYGRVWMDGRVDQPTKEIVRMRNARVNDCGYCKRVRFSAARDDGLDEATVSLVDEGWESSGLPERAKVALRFADRFIQDPGPPGADERRELAAHFSDAEIDELGLALAMFVGFAKMLITLGLEPEDMPITVVPTPGLDRAGAR